ncbi:MmyB family transcriptional regulator [Nocardia fluminea]
MPPGLPMILDQLAPLPAALLDSRYDVLAHNDAYRALFPGSAGHEAERCARCGDVPAKNIVGSSTGHLNCGHRG